MSPFDLRAIERPVIAAPMAGGPSTPELVAAVADAGGLGFLAAGYRSAEDLAGQIEQTRRLTSGPIGVNLFVLVDERPDRGAINAYARTLRPEAHRLGVELGDPHWDDDGFAAKVAVIADLRPEVVSFTFGCPPPAVLATLTGLGIVCAQTVTTPAEAWLAAESGADLLIVQGPEAGGHRATFRASRAPDPTPLEILVPQVAFFTDLPVIATGGIMSAERAAGLLGRGASAVQIGTALLDCDEAGTGPTHRAALHDPNLTETCVTRAFTGRPARSLRNRFALLDAPAAYPHIHHLTGPLRGAAMRAGDLEVAHLWAGTGFGQVRGGPAGDIVRAIAGM